LLDVAIAVAAALVFAGLAFSVMRGTTDGFDQAVREAIHARASTPLTSALKAITQLGGGWFLWPFGAIIAAVLIREGRRQEAALFAVAVLGAELLNETLKLAFHRQRPETYFGFPRPGTYSFPSGHSFLSFCFYLALAEVAIEPEWAPWRRTAVWGAAVILVLLIGLSRVYVGVHYPTDVLAGYTAAIAWTALLRAAHHRWWS
jgi:undecaprenyl-diphosphatase